MGLGAGVLAAATLAVGPPMDGVNLTAYQREGYALPAATAALDDVRETGLRRVAVVVTWYVDDLADSTPERDPARTPTDASVAAVVREARERGMSVLLKPQVDVRDGSFRGDLAPADPALWWWSYEDLVDHYATLAQDAGADALTVGVELRSLSHDAAAFERVIASARERFDGELTYAANWDEVEHVPFWPLLDLVGVDAYYPLAAEPGAGVAQLRDAWRPHIAQLGALSERVDRPVLLTELGYAARPDAAVDPARAGLTDGPLDVEAQRRAYEAAIAAWSGVPWVRGILWWDWPVDPRDAQGAAYTPRDRPAAALLAGEHHEPRPAVAAVADAIPWPLVAIVAAWAAVAGLMVAAVRRADRRRSGRRDRRPASGAPDAAIATAPRAPASPPAASPPPSASPPAASPPPSGRFTRAPRTAGPHPARDALTDLGPPDVRRVLDLTGQVLGADACALREDDEPLAGRRDWPAMAETPLLVRGRMHGTLTVARDDGDAPFDQPDLALLATMAELVAAALATPDGGTWPSPSVRGQVEALVTARGGAAGDERQRGTLAVALARQVGERLLPDDRRGRAELLLAARLHDVGMLRVPRAPLRRPGPLSRVDAHLVESHPGWGSEILAGVRGLAAVATIVRFHQERPDGLGYPHRLAGPRIPLASLAVGACAAWSAMVAGGPHAPRRTPEHAVEELRRHAGTQFDAAVVEAIAAASPLVPVQRVPV